MGRGKFKGKPTGRRQFSTPEEMLAGSSSRPRTFKQQEAVVEEEEERSEEESGEESEEESEKKKGTQGLIQIENPNLVKPKNMKARDVDLEKTSELSRREREEIEKQKAHERYMRLQEQGETEQAKKDLEVNFSRKGNRMTDDKTLSIVMYPWFAMGHLTAFLHLSNKIAERGHRIFFFIPIKTQPKLVQFNLHPDRIKFEPILVPQIEGLPAGAETTSDIPFPLQPLLRLAMDLTRPNITSFLQEIKPNFVFFDFSYWMPSVTRPLGIKAIHFFTMSPATAAYVFREGQTTDAHLLSAPSGYPSSNIRLRTHEARGLNFIAKTKDTNDMLTFMQRIVTSTIECDGIGFKACREMEGNYCEFLEKKFNKPVILAGPIVPGSPTSSLEEKWRDWLNLFEPKTVVFCAFGSECTLQKDQFQELLLGLELTGLPFFVSLKSPIGFLTIDDALPEGFKERTQGKGIVHGGWVQQQLILAHPSVGCFVTHCGSGSLSEALVSECQMVLLPHIGDQVINARVMGGDLRVGVEVEKGDEDGLFTRQGVCKSVKMVMDEDSEIGKEVRSNHSKWRVFLLSHGLESQYMDDFLHKLKELLH